LRSHPEAAVLEDDESFGNLEAEGHDKFSSSVIRGGEHPSQLLFTELAAALKSSAPIESADPKSADDNVALTSSGEEFYHDSEQEDLDEEIASVAVKTINRDQAEKTDESVEVGSRQPIFKLDSAAATDRNPLQEV
jgi:hypothetical protein